MFRSAAEDFNSLVNVWVKSAKFFGQNFWQFVLIIFITSAISTLIIYPLSSYFPDINNLQDAKQVHPIFIIAAAFGLVINQVVMTIIIVYVVLYRSKNFLLEFKIIYDFIYGKFWRYFLAVVLKTMLVALGSILYLVPGFLILTMLAMMDYLILIDDKRIVEAIKDSFNLVKSYFWPFFIFTLIFYGIPMLYLKGVFSIALLTLYTVNMLMVYMKHYRQV